jgi:hypothetical protein
MESRYKISIFLLLSALLFAFAKSPIKADANDIIGYWPAVNPDNTAPV